MCKDVVKNVKRRGFYMIEKVNRTTEKKTKKTFFLTLSDIAQENSYAIC